MKKKSLLTLVSLLMLLGSVGTASAVIPRTGHGIFATIGEPESCDPAWLYDTASATLVQNVYDSLIFFDVTTADEPILSSPLWERAGETAKFVPMLATEWSVEDINVMSPEGLQWVQRYVFKIRLDPPVKFHHGATLTTEDVEYSLERWMVQFRSGGPTWMISEPTMGVYTIRKNKPNLDPTINGRMIDHAIESNATHVWINLVMPYPPLLCILAQPWAGILEYDWCQGYKDWPTGAGAYIPFANRWGDYNSWWLFNNPEVSPLDITPVMSGTGPYKFDYWKKGVEWSLVKHDLYWNGWPAPLPYEGELYATGWLDRVTEKFIPEWATRKMMFLAGDVDFVTVPRMNTPELVLNWPSKPEKYTPGVACLPGLPTLLCSPCMFFGYDVDPTSPYLGPNFNPADPYAIGTGKIPVDFMGDIDVRKGFANLFDYNTYIRDVFLNEAERCPTPLISGLPYHDPTLPGPPFDLTAAENHFRAAHEGQIWAKGFTMGISYNTGNIERMKACEMLKLYTEGLNPLFKIDISEVDWPTYLKQLTRFQLTLFVIGWLADFPDPHNFAMPFMHPEGDYSYFQRVQYGQSHRHQLVYYVNGVPKGDSALEINNDYVGTMIKDGIMTGIDAERQAIYYELQKIYIDEQPGSPLCKPTGRHWERDWMMGWYDNPIYPGYYWYHLWKGYYGDCYVSGASYKKDYDVDLDDLYAILINYCTAVPPADKMCDFDKDKHIDLDDLFWVLINYGK